MHADLEPHLRLVLLGKQLLLVKEMLEACDYPNRTMVDGITKGFPMSGWLPKSHVSPVGLKRPSQSAEGDEV